MVVKVPSYKTESGDAVANISWSLVAGFFYLELREHTETHNNFSFLPVFQTMEMIDLVASHLKF